MLLNFIYKKEKKMKKRLTNSINKIILTFILAFIVSCGEHPELDIGTLTQALNGYEQISINGQNRWIERKLNGTVKLFKRPEYVDPTKGFVNFNTYTNACGPVAVHNLLDWYGLNISEYELGNDMGTNNWSLDFGIISLTQIGTMTKYLHSTTAIKSLIFSH